MTIGIIVAVIVAVLGIHFGLHRLMKFKMDESAILKHLRSSDSETGIHSTQAIATVTDIATERVQAVCVKSQTIQKSSDDESWSVKVL